MFFVRSADTADLAAVRALLIETWHATYDALYGVERVDEITQSLHSLAALKANLERPVSEFIVADDGRRIAGMAYAAITAPNTATLFQLYVLPGDQRQGIGRDLLAEIETCFDGASLMRLEVEAANDGAIAFYKRHGFIEAGEASSGDAVPAVIAMEKALI